MTVTVQSFIETLDTYFAHDDMKGAGVYLRETYAFAKDHADDRLLFAVLNEMMGYYRKTREVDSGLTAIDESLALVRKMGISEMVSGATAFLNAATTFKAFDRAPEGLPYYEAAEAIYRRELSPHDARLAGLHNNMALALVDIGRYSEAEERYAMSLSILSHLDGKETDIANTYVNMAHLYEIHEDYEAIETCLNRAMDALERDTNRSGYYAYTCRKCAPSFGHFGYFVYENELNERADRIYEGT